MAGRDDAIQKIERLRVNAEWAIREALQEGALKCRERLRQMVSKSLKKRSGALLTAVSTSTTKTIAGGGDKISVGLQLNPNPGTPRGAKAAQYAKVHIGRKSTIIHAKGKRLAIPIKGGPAFGGTRGNVALFQPSTYKGAKALLHGSAVLFAVRTSATTATRRMPLNAKRGSQDLVPAWILKNVVTVPARVDPQVAVEQERKNIYKLINQKMREAIKG